MRSISYRYVDRPSELDRLVARSNEPVSVAYDTEFVSEDSYQPDLCLIQVFVDGTIYLIDPFVCHNLDVFWTWLADQVTCVVVHSGREDLRFCWRAIGRFPNRVFDVQIAAGLVGLSYPVSYRTLVSELLGVELSKEETRSNWRRRPLSQQQLMYAAQDVAYLPRVAQDLRKRLEQFGRLDWVFEEVALCQQEIIQDDRARAWWRLPFLNQLNRRGLAIARHLWLWREQEAGRLNIPPRRLLRDDLIVELARRQSDNLQRIRSVRGLERRHLAKYLAAIAQVIHDALHLPEAELPELPQSKERPRLTVCSQLLTSALTTICKAAGIATSMVGSTEDVRQWILYRLQLEGAPSMPPKLARGWRAQLVGPVFDDLLMGRLGVRIRDPAAEQPLEWFNCTEQATSTDDGRQAQLRDQGTTDDCSRQ